MTSPKNFRKHNFHLFGKDFTIAGMAGAHNNLPQTKEDVFKNLKNNENIDVVIGLRGEGNDTNEAQSQGLDYHWIPIMDFHKPTLAQYDQLYETVKKATEEGKAITVHCGAGDGRTGTALASLKLRELLEQQIASDPSYLNKPINQTTTVKSSMDGYIKCTPLVAEAVEKLRSQIVPGNGKNGSHSVETKDDIEVLMEYEESLRKMFGLQSIKANSISANAEIEKQDMGLDLSFDEPKSLASELIEQGADPDNAFDFSNFKTRMSAYKKDEDLDSTDEDNNQVKP